MGNDKDQHHAQLAHEIPHGQHHDLPDPWDGFPCILKDIHISLSILTSELIASRELRKIEFEWFKSHLALATKQDLKEMEQRIMSQLETLILSATALSTASDTLSLKTDDLVLKVDKVLAALAASNTEQSPAVAAAIVALDASKVKAAAAGDGVDAEVLKVDAALPTPAPAGQPA